MSRPGFDRLESWVLAGIDIIGQVQSTTAFYELDREPANGRWRMKRAAIGSGETMYRTDLHTHPAFDAVR